MCPSEEHSRSFPQIMLPDFPDIDTVYVDSAICHFVEARDQVDDGGFAGAGGSDKGSRLTRFGGKADVMKNILLSTRIAKVHVVKFDCASERRGELLGIFEVLDLGSRFEDVCYPIGGYGGPRQDDEHDREHQESKHDLQSILHEGDHVADLYL